MATKPFSLLIGLLLLSNIVLSQIPIISSFTPASGPIGTAVTISGSNFSATTTNNIVFFGATRASVTAATANQLTVTVPVGATYLPITVIVGGLTAYSSKPFVVTSGLLGIAANSFTTPVNFATSAAPWVVSVGDLDGDGKSDMVVSSSDPIVSIFRNTSTPGTVSYSKIDITAINIHLSNTIGDVDGDGKPDLVVTNFGGSVSVFRNTSTTGNISFNAPVDFTVGSTFIKAPALEDIDGDGKVDIVVAKSNGGFRISILRNTSVVGTVSMATSVDVTTGVSPESISIGDLDGDGKPEVVTADMGTATVSIHRNTSAVGTISFATIFNVTTGTSPRSVAMGDLDGDGKKELAVANSGSNTVSIFRNISSVGTVALATKVDLTTTGQPYHVSIGNVDGDDKADLTVANNGGTSAASAFRNTSVSGTLSFEGRVDFGSSGSHTYSSIGDLDGDIKPDLVAINFGVGQVSVFRNNMGASQTITFGALATKSVIDAPFALSATATSLLPVSYTSSNTTVATISGNSVTIVGAGNTTITAQQPGNPTYSSAPNIQQLLSVNKISQSITFGALPSKTFGDAPFAISATATSSLPVSFTSSNNSIATVSGSTVTILGAGTITITASQVGNATYAQAPSVPQILTVNKANQTITFGTLATKTFGDAPFALSATATSALPVGYISSNTSVATITGSIVTIVGAGTTTITAIQNGTGNYNPASDVTQTLTVNKANQTITFGALANKTFGDAQFVLNATGPSGLAIGFISSNTSVATVSGSTVTIVGSGTTTITASQAGNGNYNPSSNVSQPLSVSKANQAITFGTLTTKTFGDAPFDLAPTTTSSLPITLVSSNLAVATVSGNTVTIVGAGTTTITASQVGNANYNAATSVPQVLTVSKANQAITFGSLPNKIVGDATFTLNAASSSGLAVSYTSSNTSVATVSGNTVTVVALGTTTITATQNGDANFNPAADVQQNLTVKSNQTITFGALAARNFGDAPINLTATTTSSLPINYTSSNTTVATISGSTVTIVGAGVTTITASQAGDANYNPAADVDQTLSVNKANQTITFGTLSDKTFGDAAFALTGTSSSSLAISYASGNTAVATVAGSAVTIVGAGTTTITASQAGDASYNSAPSVTQTLTVNKANQTVTFTLIPDKTVGDAAFALSASATSALPVSFTTLSSKVTISGSQVTIVSAGRATITAAQAGNTNFNTAPMVDRSFCIKPVKPTISVSNTNTESPSLASSSSSGNQWFRNGVIIAGATNAIYTVTQAGVYKVQATVDDCQSEFSNDQAIIITGDLQKDANLVSVYPNPVADWLTVRLGTSSTQKEVVIYQLGGKKMTSQKVSADEARFYVADYTQGVYVVRIITPDGVSVMRFMKQ